MAINQLLGRPCLQKNWCPHVKAMLGFWSILFFFGCKKVRALCLDIMWCPVNTRVFHQNESCLSFSHPPSSFDGKGGPERQLMRRGEAQTATRLVLVKIELGVPGISLGHGLSYSEVKMWKKILTSHGNWQIKYLLKMQHAYHLATGEAQTATCLLNCNMLTTQPTGEA